MSRRAILYHRAVYLSLLGLIILTYGVALTTHRMVAPPVAPEMAAVEQRLHQLEAQLNWRHLQDLVQQRPLVGLTVGLTELAALLVLITGVLLNIAFFVMLIVRWRRAQQWWQRFTAPRPSVWSLGDIGRMLVLALCCVTYFPLVERGIMALIDPGKQYASMHFLASSTYVTLLLFCMLAILASLKRTTLVQASGFTTRHGMSHTGRGLLAYVVSLPCLLLALVCSAWVAGRLGYQPPTHPLTVFFIEEQRLSWIAYGVVFACVGAPLMEELLFRGLVFPALRAKCSFLWAAILSGLLFGALHGNWVSLLPITVLGVLLAYLYETTGTLFASIVIHGIHNAIMVFFMLGYRILLDALGI